VNHLAVLIVTGLGVGVAVDGLQCPLGILELHLYILLLLRIYLFLALPLTGRSAVPTWLLLHLLMEFFRELLDLPTLQRVVAPTVVHGALRAAIVTI
jgi:hypothetical protein